MAVTEFHCTVSADDRQTGTGASTTTTVARAEKVYLPLAIESRVRADIDTSGLAGETITAATLYWYNHVASTKHKDASWSHRIYMGVSPTIYVNSAGAEAAGWNSHALTAGELASINKAGDTTFTFTVDDPGSPYNRLWQIRQWDYAPTGDFSVYLEVTHETPSGSPGKTTILAL